MRTINKMIGLTALAVAIQGCGGDTGPTLAPAPAPSDAVVVFNPALGGDGLPFPVDLLFASTADGSINIPGKESSFNPAEAGTTLPKATAVPDAAFLADPQTALNNMDGFSTTAPMVVRFSSSIAGPANRTDLEDGVRIFLTNNFDPGAQGTVNIDGELIWGVDFVAGVSGGTSLLIQPLKPLEPSSTYIVVIENEVVGASGAAVGQDSTYQLLNGSFQLAVGVPIAQPDFIIQSTDDGSCNFNSPSSVAVCTKINPIYGVVGAGVPSAATIAATLAGLEQQAIATASYSTLWQLEQLRRITAKHLGALAGEGVAPNTVALSYSVSTENIGGALSAAKAQVEAAGTAPSITVLNPITAWDSTIDIEVTSPGADGDLTTPDYLAHVYLGTLDDVIQFIDPAALNTSVWKADRADWIAAGPCAQLAASTDLGMGPVGTENLVACNGFVASPVVTDHSIPVLISAPRIESLDPMLDPEDNFEDCGGGNLPVVIYQHGITSNRATLLAIADTLASQCIVGVAIDLPKHGILPTEDASVDRFGQLALLQATLSGNVFQERLVEVSSPMTQCQATSGVAIPGDTDFYCPSGDNFINLANLANARDALRQGSVDLHSLFEALVENASSDLTAATIGTTIDTDRISFVGVSLGGIVGTSFVAQQSDLSAAVLNVTGGGIAKILDGSPSFEPSITAGLYSAAGLVKPSGSYEGYLIIAQAMVDNVDPINFASTIVDNSTPVMLQEVLGDPSEFGACIVDGDSCPDQVVPNNTFGTSFGPAWGLVAQTGQTSFTANQNFVTTPVALSGSDPLAQGTGFVAIGGAVQALLLPAANALALGPLGGDTVVGAPLTFKGLQLPTVTSCGATSGGVVRYTTGSHGSLLTPAGPQGSTQYAAVTLTMQSQMAGFVANDGGFIPADSNGVVFDPAVAGASQAACPLAP